MGANKSNDSNRFDSKTQPSEVGGCVDYIGARDRAGYGRFWVGARTVRAHRFAWERVHGPLTAGLCVCHRCDRPMCVNVDHLFVGTYEENNADRHAKGRDANGDRNGRRRHPERYAHVQFALNTPEHRAATAARNKEMRFIGEHSGPSKFSDAQVARIRELRAGGMRYKAIAAEIGCSYGYVKQVMYGTCRAVPTPAERPTWPKRV